jgi:hypothetical protein
MCQELVFWPTADGLLLDIHRLAQKLSENGAAAQGYAHLQQASSDAFKQWQQLDVQAGHLKRYSKGKETKIFPLNQEIENLSQPEGSIFSDVEAFRESVIENADKEREAAEEKYDNWTIRFYVLYVLGWVTGIVVFILGLETETEGPELRFDP